MRTILVIIGTYLPGTQAGGPIRTTSNMVNWLGDLYKFRIITVNHDFNSNVPYAHVDRLKWHQVGKSQVRYLYPDEISIFNLKHVLWETPYDLIYLDSVLATLTIKFLLLRYFRQVPNKPVVIVPRGNLDSGAISLKHSKKNTYFFLARYFGLYNNLTWHASTESEKANILKVFGQRIGKHIVVCSNLPSSELQSIQRPLADKVSGVARLVYLSRISRKKNLHYILEQLKQINNVKVQFDLYGPIEDTTYWEQCQAIISELPPEVEVRYCGSAAFEDVGRLLSNYHLFVLPTLGENFGHAILEALCAGCPVLISDTTPWRNLAEQGVGWDLSLDKPEEFKRALYTLISLNVDAFNDMSSKAQALGLKYVRNTGIVNQMNHIFNDVIENRTK